MNNTPSVHDPNPGIDNLFPSILQCFAVITCGYAAGRLRLINPTEGKGLSVFVGTFGLPALVFLSLATLEFGTVNWYFLASLFAAKMVMLFVSIAITLVVVRPLNLGRAGLVGMFCTQTNDLAIGLPIVTAIYGSTHPDFANYLYLVVPVHFIILNPICISMLELSRFRSETRDEHINKMNLARTVLKNVCIQPIVFMTALAIVWNLISGQFVPLYVSGFLTILKDAFTGSALFLLGQTMVGKVQNMKGNRLIVPFVLVLAKLLVFPVMTREIVTFVNPGRNATETSDLSTFGFLYGTFPTANIVFVFAIQYGIDVEMVSAATVACVFLSGPIMYVSAKMITVGDINSDTYIQNLNTFMCDLSIVGILASVWVLFVFVVTKRWNRLPHRITLYLLISQLMICVGGILYDTLNPDNTWNVYFQFLFLVVGQQSMRLWAAFLAVSLLYIECGGVSTARKLQPWFCVLAWGLPVIVITVLILAGWKNPNPYPDLTPDFTFQDLHSIISICVLVVCLVVTVGCLILHQRHQKYNAQFENAARETFAAYEDEETGSHSPLTSSQRNYGALPTITEGFSDENLATDDAARLISVVDEQTANGYGVRNFLGSINDDTPPTDDNPQITRHILLLISLLCLMFVSLATSVWTLMLRHYSGVYFELSFLDTALMCGQSVFILMLFGLDVKILLPLVDWWRKVRGRPDAVTLPALSELAPETRHVAEQFRSHHLDKCAVDIAMDKRRGWKVYKNAFTGCILVEWLIEVGLVQDRVEGVQYGERLLEGRVIAHVDNVYHFYDRHMLYKFI